MGGDTNLSHNSSAVTSMVRLMPMVSSLVPLVPMVLSLVRPMPLVMLSVRPMPKATLWLRLMTMVTSMASQRYNQTETATVETVLTCSG